jgi:ketosteroid isomerase-like protein
MGSADVGISSEGCSSPSSDIAVVRAAFEAFAANDVARMRQLGGKAVFRNAVTGVAVGKRGYTGDGALDDYLADVAEVWSSLDLRPRTYRSPRPGEVLVLGTVVRTLRDGHTIEAPTAWRFKLTMGKITMVEVLPSAEGLAGIF